MMMKPEESLTMEKLLNELQSVDTVKLVLTGCGESIYGSREVYEAIRPFVEKQVPKKVTFRSEYLCGNCNATINSEDCYCYNCGQRQDWSEIDET